MTITEAPPQIADVDTVLSCEKHGPMTQRVPGTKEQAFCGTWYVCEHTDFGQTCGATTLLPSPELLDQLDKQRLTLEGK